MTLDTATTEVLALPGFRGPGYGTIYDAERRMRRLLAMSPPDVRDLFIVCNAPPGPVRRGAASRLAGRYSPVDSPAGRLWARAEIEVWAGVRRPTPLRLWARRLGVGLRTLERYRLGVRTRLRMLSQE